jgi:hypothetical protein
MLLACQGYALIISVVTNWPFNTAPVDSRICYVIPHDIQCDGVHFETALHVNFTALTSL